MTVVAVDIQRRSSYENGISFGEYGSFERIEGTLHYAVDPHSKQNSSIVDIELAPRDESGLVRFSGDFTLIAPTRQRPRSLLLEVPNRGNRLSFRMFNRAKPDDLTRDPCSAGDGFLFRHGIALLSVGWQFDAVGMKLAVPEALENGERISGEVVCQIQPSRNTKNLFIGQLGPSSYRPSEESNANATLYERSNPNENQRALDSSKWQFGRQVHDKLEQSEDHIYSPYGFRAGKLYTLVYPTTGAPVVGLGLLALRDAGACFRSTMYPGSTSPPPSVVAFGASQTGRVLRHLLFEGLNETEEGQMAFDGVMPHIAGAQRGDFNHRFAQPSSIGVPACGQLFPFAGRTTTDSLTGVRDGLFRDREFAPKVLTTNTSWEYWRGDAALSHITSNGRNDVDPLSNERIYLFAGTHHINAVLPVTDRFVLTNDRVRYPMNTVSYTPLIRAALLNMIDWVEGDSSPPQSQIPRLADGTLVSREVVINKFVETGKFEQLPESEALTFMSTLDLGPNVSHGICSFPAVQGDRYPALVCDVGTDLNEVAGIRLPDLVVPLGVHTGWNPRHRDHGGEDQIAAFVGFSMFNKDLVNKHSKSNHLKQVGAVVDRLLDECYVLQEDRELLLSTAEVRFDLAATQIR